MFTLIHDPITGRFINVRRTADGAVIVPNPIHPQWREFLAWNSAQPTPLSLADKPAATAVQRLTDQKTEAKAGAGKQDADAIIRRAIARVLWQRAVIETQQLNALRTKILTPAATLPAALAVPTWPQMMAAVRAAVDAETDPEA